MATDAHAHVHHRGDALTAAARAAIEGSQQQWTEMRAAVFEALAGFKQPASAYDIAEEVGNVLGRRVAANSVYRILDLFVASNVAMRVESRNAYLANAHPGCVHDCVFLVCDGCGATAHLDDDSLGARVRSAASSTGFKPERPVIEVRGRCADCA